jgi:S-DNA-T family DNA segregation ATPase FtsK/SpoIIIE
MPYIVVIVDEMSDLMLVAGKEIENYIQKLSQMARAAGIHIIMATQRPSVDVITGTIKANFPTRISFRVSSKIDSRTILGEQGSEQLLGNGDMLFMSSANRIVRIHGPYVSEKEIEKITNVLRAQGRPDYIDEIITSDKIDNTGVNTDNQTDELYNQALDIVKSEGKASTSFLQRKLLIGYNRAARIIDMMEEKGVVSKANHVGKREVL